MSKNSFARITLLISMVLLCGIAAAEEGRFYRLDMLYESGKLGLKNVAVLPGSISQTAQGDYKVEVVSFQNAVLYNSTFEVVMSFHAEDFDPATGTFTTRTIQLNKTDLTLNVPYFSNGKQIDIYNTRNQKVLEIPVLQFADTCGNAACEPQESYESCPRDCPSGGKDDFCDGLADNKCDPDCIAKQDADCVSAPPDTKIIAAAVAVFGAAVILLRIYRKRASDNRVERMLKKFR